MALCSLSLDVATGKAAVISRGRETRIEQVALDSFISRWSILSMVGAFSESTLNLEQKQKILSKHPEC